MTDSELQADIEARLDQAMKSLDALTVDAALVIATVRSPDGSTITGMRKNGNTWTVRGMTQYAMERWLEEARIEERQYQKRSRGD